MTRTLLSLAAVLALTASAASAQDAAPKGDAVRGYKLYVSIGCFQCHGYQGSTGGPGGRLAPAPQDYDFVMNQLRHPRGRMPIYTPLVAPDQDVADIYAYLKAQPAAKQVADIPLLNH